MAVGERNEAALRAYAGRPVMVGIRPEHIALGSHGNEIEGVVDVVEQLGSEMHVDLRVGEASVTIARVPPDAAIRSRERVKASIPTQSMHFFDVDTQQAIRAAA